MGFRIHLSRGRTVGHRLAVGAAGNLELDRTICVRLRSPAVSDDWGKRKRRPA
jgi:hypothetical protein